MLLESLVPRAGHVSSHEGAERLAEEVQDLERYLRRLKGILRINLGEI